MYVTGLCRLLLRVMTYPVGFAEWTYPAGFAEWSMERQTAWRMLQAHSSREKMKEMQASSARIKERTARIKERTARLLERGPQFDREVALERGKFFPSLPFPSLPCSPPLPSSVPGVLPHAPLTHLLTYTRLPLPHPHLPLHPVRSFYSFLAMLGFKPPRLPSPRTAKLSSTSFVTSSSPNCPNSRSING